MPAAICEFKVQTTQLADRVFTKVLKATDGSMTFLSTGAAKIRFTNPANGKTITENTSGPVKETDFADGSMTFLAKGLQPNILGPVDAARFGLPAFLVTAGALTATVAPGRDLTSVTLRGHVVVDVRAALS